MSDRILLKIEGAVATLTLNRPEKHNSLEAEDIELLHKAFAQLQPMLDVRVLILTGAGKSFCSGVDFQTVQNVADDKHPLQALCDALVSLPQTTICALNGGVFGGGVELALSCDLVWAAPGIKMFVPPAKLGVHYPISGLKRFVQILGVGIAKRLILAAEEFDSQGLVQIGLVHYLATSKESLLTEVQAQAERLAGHAPLSMRHMKRAINEIASGDLDLERANAAVRTCFTSEDLKEGLLAMKEKRRPNFVGR